MRKTSTEECRAIAGGRWKCKQCGKKFWAWIGAFSHWGTCPKGMKDNFWDQFKFIL